MYSFILLFNSHFCYIFSSSSENEESIEDDESSTNNESQRTTSKENTPEPLTFKSLFPTMKEVYGADLKNPCEDDIFTYKK